MPGFFCTRLWCQSPLFMWSFENHLCHQQIPLLCVTLFRVLKNLSIFYVLSRPSSQFPSIVNRSIRLQKWCFDEKELNYKFFQVLSKGWNRISTILQRYTYSVTYLLISCLVQWRAKQTAHFQIYEANELFSMSQTDLDAAMPLTLIVKIVWVEMFLKRSYNSCISKA